MIQGVMDRRKLALQVLWNLRTLALFLIGPVIGVWLVAAVFGLPRHLLVTAVVVFLFTLGMFGLLVRGEWRRLARLSCRHSG